MWKNAGSKRSYWIGIGPDVDALLEELGKAEAEEDCGIYSLKMYLNHDSELSVFTPSEREEICAHLAVLIKESQKHLKIITRIGRLLEIYRGKMM